MTFDDAARLLQAAGIESPRAEARLLLAHMLGISRDEALSATIILTPNQAEAFATLVKRRAGREPCAYITGRKEFWSLDFAVGPGVLVPRPETETLIEEARKIFPDPKAPLKIADLGTGSGAILIAALHEFPHAHGTGFESSPAALAWAKRNAKAQPRAQIYHADWSDARGPFDLIFSNPPYIPTADIAGLDPEVSNFEPRAALDGGPDGLAAYRVLAGLLPLLLAPGGRAILEIGAGQGAAMEPLFQGSGLELVRIVPDLAGISRALVLENRD